MNKQIEKYFDWKFEGGEIDTRPYEDNQKWTGIWIGDFLVIGCPELEDTGLWFSNGPHFQGGSELFDISHRDFNNEMEKYIIKNYPDVYIREVM